MAEIKNWRAELTAKWRRLKTGARGLLSTDGDQKHNQPMRVRGNGSERMVFAFEGFSLPDDKQLEVTIHERNGGRTLSFRVQNEDLLRARRIDHLKLQLR